MQIGGRLEAAGDDAQREAFLSSLIIPPDFFFSGFPGYATVKEDDYLLWNGNPLLIGDMVRVKDAPGEYGSASLQNAVTLPEEVGRDAIRMYDSEGAFWGLYIRSNRRGLYRPWKMFPPTQENHQS